MAFRKGLSLLSSLNLLLKRKQTFDALLQVEDYKLAAENLRSTINLYKDQMAKQQLEVQRLTLATSDLEMWRLKLKEARLLDTSQKEQNVQWSQQLSLYEARALQLNAQLQQLLTLEQAYYTHQREHEHAQLTLQDRSQQLQVARDAQQIVQANTQAHSLYLQAHERLQHLRLRALQRDRLLQQQAQLQNTQGRIEEKLLHTQHNLEKVALARQKVIALAELVDQQVDLEHRREEALQKVARYEALRKESQRLQAQLTKNLQEQTSISQTVAQIEPLLPTSELLSARGETLTQLRIQLSERTNKNQQLQEKQNLLRERQLARDQTAERLRRDENNLAVIEEHRQEAEEVPLLQEQHAQLAEQKHRIEGNIEGYVRSRAQSAGGQCPLLNESCLNIKQRGIVSLESYFDGLLTTEHARVATLVQQQDTVNLRINQVRKFYEALSRVGEYVAKRESNADKLQGIATDIKRLERDIVDLSATLDTLKLLEEQVAAAELAYQESKQADQRVRELDGLRKQLQQLQQQAQHYKLDIDERDQEAALLQGNDVLRDQIIRDLANLDDPRSQSQAQRAIIAEEHSYSQQLQADQLRLQDTTQQLQALTSELAAYKSLDADIASNETTIQQNNAGRDLYLQHQQEAKRLPAITASYEQQLALCQRAFSQLCNNKPGLLFGSGNLPTRRSCSDNCYYRTTWQVSDRTRFCYATPAGGNRYARWTDHSG